MAVYVFYGGLLLAGVWGAALRLVPGFRSWAWRTRPRLPSGSYGQVSNYGQVREPLRIPQQQPDAYRLGVPDCAAGEHGAAARLLVAVVVAAPRRLRALPELGRLPFPRRPSTFRPNAR